MTGIRTCITMNTSIFVCVHMYVCMHIYFDDYGYLQPTCTLITYSLIVKISWAWLGQVIRYVFQMSKLKHQEVKCCFHGHMAATLLTQAPWRFLNLQSHHPASQFGPGLSIQIESRTHRPAGRRTHGTFCKLSWSK